VRQSFWTQVRRSRKCEGSSLKNIALKAAGQGFHVSQTTANNFDFAELSGYSFPVWKSIPKPPVLSSIALATKRDGQPFTMRCVVLPGKGFTRAYATKT
jgi:hypothetical protein